MTTLTTSRIFPSSPAALYAAFATPERLARWWGPNGFHSSFDVFDFAPGGRWCFTMHGPDGTDYPNESVFPVVEPSKKIVVQHISQPHFILTIGLESVGDGTRVTWEQAFESAEVMAAIRHICEPANEQNLDRWWAEVCAVQRS